MSLTGCSKSEAPTSGPGAGAACSPTTVPCPLDCPTKVEFKEHNTVYGFDDFTVAGVPWKSVEKGKSDTVIAEITPPGKFANVQFTSSATAKVTVSPASAASGSQVVTVTGVDNGESEIKASCGGAELGKMKAKTYTRKTKTVAVRLVHETRYTSTDVPDATIQAYLKKVYDQAVFEFTVTRLPAKTVAFDLNRDGKIDVDSWMSAEMRKIRDACKDDSYDHNIFLVNKSSDNSAGFMDFNQRYGFIHPDVGEPKKSVAHELGHGSAGLSHTPADSENIMFSDYSSAKWRLRKDQWDKINP